MHSHVVNTFTRNHSGILTSLALVVVAAAPAEAQTASNASACTHSIAGLPAPAGPGVSIGVIDASALAPFASRTLSEALTARLPGVSVMRSSGVAGTGSRVRMRGPSDIIVTQQPLLYIDGIRVDEEQQSIMIDAGG